MVWLNPSSAYFTPLVRSRYLLGATLRGAALLLFAVIVMHCTVYAQTPLIPSDVQLRGAQSRQTIPIHVNTTVGQPVEIKLDWAMSPMIDGKRSIINVVINGQIRSTRRVSDLDGRPWRISLRPLPPGKHELTLQAYLRGKDDDCIPLPESLWVTLLNASTIRGAVVSVSNNLREGFAVRDFPDRWKTSNLSQAVEAQNTKPSVLLMHDLEWNERGQSAWLHAWQFLNHHGLNPQVSQDPLGQTGSARRLTLRTFDRLAADHPARKRWTAEKNTLFVLYAVSPSHLEVISKTSDRFHLAFELLDDVERRQICHENICSVSDAEKSLDLGKKMTSARADAPALWRMTSGDQPRGWTAQGVGAHRLRQVWVRPLSTDLQSDVFLHLAARASQAEQIDNAQSSISIRINDQPLATYSLASWKSSDAKIRIPQSLWRANVWVIDFDVRLVPRNLQRCSYLVQEDYWVTIDPETQIQAAYRNSEVIGIAGFWQRAMLSPAVSVTWADLTSKAPTEQQLASFAPLLRAFRASSGEPYSPRVVFIPRGDCKTSACVVLHLDASGTRPNDDVLSWKRTFSKTPDQARGIPDLGAKGTAAITWIPVSDANSEQLHLLLGMHSGSTLTTPPLSSFSGSIALHTDQWQFFSDESALRTNLAVNQTGRTNTSQQQGRLRWVNLIWALVSILVIAGFAIVYWRKKRTPDPKTWEVQ